MEKKLYKKIFVPGSVIMLYAFAVLAMVLPGCRKLLEIQPNDRLLENEVFNDRNAIFGVLNGIYTQMGADDSYGRGWTMTVPDLLAQYYDKYPNSYIEIVNGNYTASSARELTAPLWSRSYNLILQTNILMGHVTRDRDNGLSESDRNILLGETRAIRAFLHFDLLRLFGPVYSTGSQSPAIPYNKDEIQRVQRILPAQEVMQYIKADLDSAALLLKDDPVIKTGITNTFGPTTGENFMQRRNFRLNYFAVKALQARVSLYAGDKPAALKSATEVIDQAKDFFPWSPAEASLPGSVTQDLTFSSEHLFALFNKDLYSSYLALFSPALADGSVIKPDEKGLLTFYDGNVNDFRYRGWWRLDVSAKQKTRIFFRYSQPIDIKTFSVYMQPLIRMSEMYFIAAESTPDPVAGLNFLNVVRANRGLTRLEANADLAVEIEKEFRREFWGEGQLFFYYKRKNVARVPVADATASMETFSPQRYTIPLPVSETLNR